MDWEPRKLFCTLRNFKKIGEGGENVGTTRSHVAIISDKSTEAAELLNVFRRQ